MTGIDLKKWGQIGFFALSAFAILPFCILCFYNQPIGLHEWDWITNLGGEYDGQSFFAYQKFFYFDCMGRYASTALMSFTPYFYSDLNYKLLFLGCLLLTLFSIFYFVIRCYRDRVLAAYFSLGIFIVYLSKVCGVYDSIYRFSGILTYQFGAIFLLILVGLIIKSIRNGEISWLKLPIICALGFITVGMNEVSMIAANYLCAITLFAHRKKQIITPRWFWMVVSSIAIGSILAVFAPGNFNRMGPIDSSFGLLEAVFTTFGCAIFSITSWFSDLTLPVATILAVPLLVKFAAKKEVKILFSSPGTWLGLSMFFVVLAYFPLVLGTKGASFAERVVDLTFFHFCFGWLGFAQSCAVKLVARHPNLNVFLEDKNYKQFNALLSAFFFAHVVFGKLEIDRISKNLPNIERIKTTSNIGQAYLTWIKGEAKNYQKAVYRQYEAIGNCKTDTCFVEKPVNIPIQLYEEISDRRNRESGELFMGKYYNPGVKVVKYKQ